MKRLLDISLYTQVNLTFIEILQREKIKLPTQSYIYLFFIPFLKNKIYLSSSYLTYNGGLVLGAEPTDSSLIYNTLFLLNKCPF